uniref:Uncharacterized protein n=1 Tax=Strigamia maritima TaxID=126957 RepID=T1IPK1_STRMM
MDRNCTKDSDIYTYTNTSKKRFADTIDKICKKYENDTRVDVEVVDWKDLEDHYDTDTDEDSDPNQSKDLSESDEDYVESSYNDGRCSSSLTSSNYNDMKSPNTSRINEIGDYNSRFSPFSDFKSPEEIPKERRKNIERKGNIIRLENTDIFVDVLRTAQLQKKELMRNFLRENEMESSDDEEFGAKETKTRTKGEKFKNEMDKSKGTWKKLFKNSKEREKHEVLKLGNSATPFNAISSGEIYFKTLTGKNKSDLSGISEKKLPDDDLDVNFLEEPDYDALKDDGMFTIEKCLRKNKFKSRPSSSSSCSFDTDSLDSPINRESKKEKKWNFTGMNRKL